MNSLSKSKQWQKLQTKEYRDGYAEAQLSIEIPFQIRALRKARGWTQAQLAERCGIPQARISHIEQPGRDPLALRTLYRLSSAFDVGLLVQFVSFSELVHRQALFNPETFYVASFEDDQLWEVSVVSTNVYVPIQLDLGQATKDFSGEDLQLTEIAGYLKHHYRMSPQNALSSERGAHTLTYKRTREKAKTGTAYTHQMTKMENFKTATCELQTP